MKTLTTDQKTKLVKFLDGIAPLPNETTSFIDDLAENEKEKVELKLIAHSSRNTSVCMPTPNEDDLVKIKFNPGPSKLYAVKEIRDNLDVSLMEAKNMIERGELTCKKELVPTIVKALEYNGATIQN